MALLNKDELKKDLIALCKKHNVTIYASEDDPCTIVDENVAVPDNGEMPAEPLETMSFSMVTPENLWEY